MLLVVISPLPLNVEDDKLRLLVTGTSGSDSGKHVYINEKALENHSKFYFDGGEFNSTLTILKNELNNSKNIRSTLANWFDAPSILSLSADDIDDFNQIYEHIKDEDAIKALATIPYGDNSSIVDYILLSGLGDLFSILRKIGQEGDV